jgi:hypothetical protein
VNQAGKLPIDDTPAFQRFPVAFEIVRSRHARETTSATSPPAPTSPDFGLRQYRRARLTMLLVKGTCEAKIAKQLTVRIAIMYPQYPLSFPGQK